MELPSIPSHKHTVSSELEIRSAPFALKNNYHSNPNSTKH